MLRNIVSFSRGPTSDETTFMVHCLVDADHVREQQASNDGEEQEPRAPNLQPVYRPRTFQDEAVYLGKLK